MLADETVTKTANEAVAPNKEIERLGVELADGLYPIVQGLQAKAVAPLASKAVALATTGDIAEI